MPCELFLLVLLLVLTSCAQLDLGHNQIGSESAKPLANALHVNGSLTFCNFLQNEMDIASAQLLVEAVKDKDVSLAGITPDQTEANFQRKGFGLKPPDAVLLASDLSKAGVSACLTKIDLRNNRFGDEGWGAIFKGVCSNKDSKITAMDASRASIGLAGAKLIAEALKTNVSGSLKKIS